MSNTFSDFFKPAAEIAARDASATASANSNAKANEDTGISAVPDAIDNKDKIPGSSGNQPNPLDVYSKMLENAGKSKSEGAPDFTIDPNILNDVAGGMDFMSGLDPETLTKAKAGDTEALISMMDHVGKSGYKAALTHQAKLTGVHLDQRSTFDESRIKSAVNKGHIDNALSSAPNYNHPVVKAELNRVATEYSAQHPEASNTEVAEAAQAYIREVASALNPAVAKPGQDTKGQQLEMDWSSYLK